MSSRDYSEAFIEGLVEYFSPETLLEKAREQHILVAVDDDGEIVGTAALANFGSAEAEPDYYAVSVFVVPEQHRKRVGTRLMQAVEAQARVLHASRITVRAAMSAKGFYQKLGYTFKDGIEALAEHKQYKMVKDLGEV